MMKREISFGMKDDWWIGRGMSGEEGLGPIVSYGYGQKGKVIKQKTSKTSHEIWDGLVDFPHMLPFCRISNLNMVATTVQRTISKSFSRSCQMHASQISRASIRQMIVIAIMI